VCGPATWFGVVVTPGLYYVVSIGYQLEQKGDVDGQGLMNTLVPCLFLRNSSGEGQMGMARSAVWS